MARLMEYQIVLLTDEGAATYESTALIASTNFEAVEKAKTWTKSLDAIADDAWLQISLNGIGIRCLGPGGF